MTTIIDTIDVVVRTRLKPKRGRGNGLGVVTHAQVAEALGLHWEQWSQYRRGTVPKLSTLESMADAAGLVLTRRPEGEWMVRRPWKRGPPLTEHERGLVELSQEQGDALVEAEAERAREADSDGRVWRDG